MEECVIKYHYGGTISRDGELRYVNGQEVDFLVDLDKLCYWDLLADMQDLRYNTLQLAFFFVDDAGILKNVCDDETTMALCDHLRRHSNVDVYVESTMELNPNGENEVGVLNLESNIVNEDENDEERLVDVPFVDYVSDEDEEREQGRDIVSKYGNLKKSIQDEGKDNDEEQSGDENPGGSTCEGMGYSEKITAKDGKVSGYQSDYIESSDPSSHEDISEGYDGDGAKWHTSMNKHYDNSMPLDDFIIDLRFVDLKQFKRELVASSTRKEFEFIYLKNDTVRVRARCSAKDYKWLILYSWCSARKLFVVKNYVGQHSCVLKTTKNKRVIT